MSSLIGQSAYWIRCWFNMNRHVGRSASWLYSSFKVSRLVGQNMDHAARKYITWDLSGIRSEFTSVYLVMS